MNHNRVEEEEKKIGNEAKLYDIENERANGDTFF